MPSKIKFESIVKELMKNVIKKKHGTAHNIYTEDFSMAGKTGTSKTEYWKSDELYISSFVGFFPVEKPMYSCIVVIHKPNKSKGYYGNIVAAPVFKEIAQKIYTNIPSVENYDLKFSSVSNKIFKDDLAVLENMIMPDLTKYDLIDIIPFLENAGFKVIVEGSGNNIQQINKAGSRIKKGEIIKIKLI